MTEKRGSVGFSSTYRPPFPLEIFSSPATPVSKQDEVHMSDGVSYNYNGREIPSPALKTILKRPIFTNCEYNVNDVDSGALTGMVFVSERDRGLETVHIAIRRLNGTMKAFSVADVFGTFNGIRMEDTSSVAVGGGGGGDYLIYITTKDHSPYRRQPWTAVYKTNLTTGETTRLTPIGDADLSPSVHPSGTKIAVASFQGKTGGWAGEIEDLKTNIYVIDVEAPFERKQVVENGGWPTWGSDDVLFFHRKEDEDEDKDKKESTWGVFRADNIGGDGRVSISRVTPYEINAMTPAAINATTVAVATIRKKSGFLDERTEEQYRHIEIFQQDATTQTITQTITPMADHFNPFVIDGGKRIGYHRCKSDQELKCTGNIQNHSNKLASPHPDVGVFRMPGIFPTFSEDGSKLAFVDNSFTNVWVYDSKGLRKVYTSSVGGHIFSPVWNQDPKKDILYVNSGPALSASKRLDIIAIHNVSEGKHHPQLLTKKGNNAFPSTNPDGTKLVFRSTVYFEGKLTNYKNLYIMNDVQKGVNGGITRLTEGDWTDTHCQWSPSGDWIVFSSSRDKPKDKLDQSDNGLDPGYFSVFLVKADDPNVCVRVAGSGSDGAGHVNHPFFSPDGMSIVVASDLAGVSADPISLPLFLHSVRPYGDIFIIDIDPHNINKNKEVKNFRRITHSRYENSTACWTMFSTEDPKAEWNQLLNKPFASLCPASHSGGGETWYNTGHLWIHPRCC